MHFELDFIPAPDARRLACFRAVSRAAGVSFVVAGDSGAAVYSDPVQDFIKLFSSFQAEQKVHFFRIQQVYTDLNSEHFTHTANSGPHSD